MRNYSSLYAVLTLWLAGLCAASQFAKIALIIPELQLLYPDAGSALGFLVSLISLVGALLGLIAGLLVSQFDSRKILIFALLLGAIVSFIQSFVLPINLFLLSRIIEGASHLAIVVSAPTLIAQHSSDRYRDSAMTLWGTFFGVSFALTAWFGLPLVGERGVSALMLAHAVITALTALLVVHAFRGIYIPTNNEKRTSFSIITIAIRHKEAWKSPTIAAPAVGWLFYTTTFVALLAILPRLLAPDQREIAASLLPLASIASSMTLGIYLLRRYSAVQVVNTGFVLCICAALLLPLFFGEPTIIVSLFLAFGLVQGASFASIPQLNNAAKDQALANGTLAQAGNIGNLFGTPFLFMMLNNFGLVAMCTVVAFCYSAAICAHLIFAKRRIKSASNSCP